MRTIIAGGTGFLGRALARALVTAGHDVVGLTRGAGRGPTSGGRTVSWTPDGQAGPWASEVDGATAVVNLAGESIAARRWSAAQKRRIHDSRVLATRSLVEAIRKARQPPQVFVSGSAVGLLRTARRRSRQRSQRAGHRFPVARRRGLGSRGARRRVGDARRHRSHGARARPQRRRAAADAAAVLVRRRRAGRIGTAGTGPGSTCRTGSISFAS